MSVTNVAAVALVITVGLIVGVLGLVAADLYAVGVLILFLGGIGVAVLVGEYLIWYFSVRRPPALRHRSIARIFVFSQRSAALAPLVSLGFVSSGHSLSL